MATTKTVTKIILIGIICVATMMSVSCDVPNGHAKQAIVPDNFIGPLAINQEYESKIRTVSMTTFYGNVLTVNVSEYYRN